MTHSIRLSCLLLLLSTSLNAQISWSSANFISRSSAEIGVADFDQDGNPDIAICAADQRWYQGPSFTTWYKIGDSDGGPYAARVADINNDGWDDFITSDGARNEVDTPGHIYVYLNPADPALVTSPWQRIIVYSGNVRHQNDMRIADMDGDGLLDIIERTWSSERVVVALQNPDINTWTVRTFDTGETGKPEGISAGDIDGDGENEIVLSGVYWDNPGGWRTGPPVEYSIDPLFTGSTYGKVKSEVGDIDNDGDNDVYMGSAEGADRYLAWYENEGPDGSGGTNFTRHIIKDVYGKCHVVQLVDIDQDGDLDLCTGRSFGQNGVLVFYNNGDGSSWTEQNFDPTGNMYTGVVADLDADGDLDFVGPSGFYDPVRYYINQTPVGPPDAPVNFVVNLIDGLQVNLSWDDVADNEGGYTIERLEGGTSTTLATLPSNTTDYADNSTGPSTLYQYRVRAFNAAGTSSWVTDPGIQTWDQAGGVSISPVGGAYLSTQTISITADSPFDEIRYTLDGSEPGPSSSLYTGSFLLDSSAVIKAVALGSMLIPSDVLTENYAIAIGGNFPPEADAGLDLTVTGFDPVTLNGSATTDLDDAFGSLSFSWIQLSGPPANLFAPGNPLAAFLPTSAGNYIFQLSVSDEAATSTDQVEITVQAPYTGPTPVYHWPLDENTGSTATDIVAGETAALSGGASFAPADGQVLGAVDLDGSTGRVEAGALDIGGNAMSISVWINPADLDNVEGRIVSKASSVSGTAHYWMLSQIAGSGLRFRLQTDNGGTETLASATGQIAASSWYFVTAVYDGSEMRIYNNAVLIASVAKAGNIIANPTVGVAIGNQPFGAGDRPFSGKIDDVRLFDQALSEADILALYEEGLNEIPTPFAYWPLDETAGSIAAESVNGLDATLNAGASFDPLGGQIGGSLDLDGAIGRADIPPFDLTGNSLSLSMWVQLEDLSVFEGRILSKASGTSRNDHYWAVSTVKRDGLGFGVQTDTGGIAIIITPSGLLSPGNWHFVTAVYTGTAMLLYLDGNLVRVRPHIGEILQAPAVGLAIGNQPSGAGDRPFNGKIDEVRIYDMALSGQQVQQLYLAGAGPLAAVNRKANMILMRKKIDAMD